MAGTIQKLKQMKSRLTGKADDSIVVPFEVRCDCGEVVRGARRDSWIECECPNCSQTLFILPANVYPSTKLVPSEILGGTFSDRLKIIISDLLPKREFKQPRPARKLLTKAETTENAELETTEAESIVRPPIKFSLPKIDVQKAVKRTFTPFRLLMLGMSAMLVLTGYWMSHKNTIESAQQIWLKSTDDVVEYLGSRKFIELEVTLKQAVQAGIVLGKSDPDWRSTVNLYQETSAVNNMASGDLLTRFQNAYDENGRLTKSAQQSVMSVAETGSFVVDSFLKRDESRAGSFLIDLPASPGRHPVKASIELPQLSQFLDAHSDGRIFFAARIGSVTAPVVESQNAAATDAWFLKIEPHSFVMFTNEALSENIGLPVNYDPELAHVLGRQSEFVRGSETWEFRGDDVAVNGLMEQASETPK